MQAWNGMVNKMRGDIQTWTVRQSKHTNYGWPLTTLLTCLLDDQSFLANFDGLIDNLHRLLKVGVAGTISSLHLAAKPEQSSRYCMCIACSVLARIKSLASSSLHACEMCNCENIS